MKNLFYAYVRISSLISVFVVHCLDSIIPVFAKSKLASVAEQAGSRLT